MEFQLDPNGYVTHYLYSGRKESEFHDNTRDTNQLRYEKSLRSRVAKHEPIPLPENIRLGENSSLGMPWKYYYSGGNIFLDDSSFYIEMCRVDLLAVTELVVERDQEIVANLWSYAAVDLWVNGELAGTIEKPVYKPIQRNQIKLALKKGKNQIFIRLETLGVRDTRTAFALQLLEHPGEVFITLPDEENVKPYVEAEELLNTAVLLGDRLEFKRELPSGSSIIYDTGTVDYRKYHEKYMKEDISGKSKIILKNFANVQVRILIGNSTFIRNLEQIHLQKAAYLHTTKEENHETIYKKIGEVTSIIREETDGFALYPMLSRYYNRMRLQSDEEELRVTLQQIKRRMDCADFMTCALIRFLKNYYVSKTMWNEIKQVMLDFRYWMDEDGQDGMCFWSENHSLMFYQTAYFFGAWFPEDIFLRSGKTGREMQAQARERLIEWFTDVCEQGYDEFNSGVYSPITLAAVLNIVDYAEEKLSDMAVKAADLLVRTLSLHCFKGVIISPQGRVYRDVLYPFKQDLQSLVQYNDWKAPYVYSEWLITLATSKYKMPDDISEWMQKTGFYSYSSSNAVIDLYKTKDYILTSVESPRRDGIKRVWERESREEHREHFIYTKSLNECFHGTMQFEPGVYGYQQHLWYAALDKELAIFINHPGQSCEAMTEVRPGYWYGNGIMPALRQEKNVLGIIYVIPETYPIHFTHLFWNEKGFDETESYENWLFGRKNDGYIGIWCNQEMIAHNDVLFNCEKRNYGSKNAYMVVCGSKSEWNCFEAFKADCGKRKVIFSEESNTLDCSEFSLKFEPHFNESQNVE